MTNIFDFTRFSADVLVIGAGAAGMSAALAAAERGANVLLIDRSLIGRGGATIMAQMTVAAALGEEVVDDPRAHLSDTLNAGRGLCNPKLAEIVCEYGPEELRRLDQWNVGWARHADGRIRQIQAPGHDRPRCAYVDFLSSGPAISKVLRTQLQGYGTIRKVGDLCVTDLVLRDGVIRGAVGFILTSGCPVAITAKSVILATGGLTRLYRRNSASLNMGGDGYALGLRAGCKLIDMEFVQFFPIGHLAPRLVGLDPIMWDPFRYKLGGRLLNGAMEEFVERYGAPSSEKYTTTRDETTYAILKEVKAGRGSPAGGAYLSFRHISQATLHNAFGPIIDRLHANGIDLTKDLVEVAPMAHYHMGGLQVDLDMKTTVPGLYAAGEVIGGANGANRLSGNALTECLVFGRRAGVAAVNATLRQTTSLPLEMCELKSSMDLLKSSGNSQINMASIIQKLQDILGRHVGPFRNEKGLLHGVEELHVLREEAGHQPPGTPDKWNANRIDWFDLRNGFQVAECVAQAALLRQESRGAHQREDFPTQQALWDATISISQSTDTLELKKIPLSLLP